MSASHVSSPQRSRYGVELINEVSRWDVTFKFERGSKHNALRVETPDGEVRRLHFACTPSDNARGHLNAASDLRRLLNAMGARLRTDAPAKPKASQPALALAFDAALTQGPRRLAWKPVDASLGYWRIVTLDGAEVGRRQTYDELVREPFPQDVFFEFVEG
jgi:hypothetical protein